MSVSGHKQAFDTPRHHVWNAPVAQRICQRVLLAQIGSSLMHGFAAGVGSKTDTGAAALIQLSNMRWNHIRCPPLPTIRSKSVYSRARNVS